jgi:hypothetical protein
MLGWGKWIESTFTIQVGYFEEAEGGHFRFPVFKRIMG